MVNKGLVQTYKIVLAALFVALGFVLPFLTGQIQQFGSMLLPMHIPVILAGFCLGPYYGLLVGFITPLLRSLVFGMPPIYPTALAMAFELAGYGFASGLSFKLLDKVLGKKRWQIILNSYISLIIALVFGRVIYGIVMYILTFITPGSVTINMNIYINAVFLNAWPGIILQLVIIPPIVYLIKRYKLIDILLQPQNKEKYISLLYDPKYYDEFNKLDNLINEKLKEKDCIVIVIDGMSGSGKTNLANNLKDKYDARVFHMDDFYLSKDKRKDDIAGNIDFEKFEKEIVNHIKNDISYSSFNCSTQSFNKEENVPFKKVTIIEGTYSMFPKLEKYYDISIVLSIKDKKQLRRIKRRNPKKVDDFTSNWIPRENKYLSFYKIEEKADININL